MISLWMFVIFSTWLVQGLPPQKPDKTDTTVYVQSQLLKNLLKDYDKRILPQINSTRPVNLSIGIRLINVVELFEHEEILETGMYLQMFWTDFRLSWDPSKYARITVIHVPVEELWQPDIVLFNNADVRLEAMNTLAVIFNNGQVFYAPKSRIRTMCAMDMTRFPFDHQMCSINVGSYTYDGRMMELSMFAENNTFDTTEYQVNDEWGITSTSASIVTKRYACCPDQPYQHVRFDLKLKRNTVYYTHVFILPAVILAFLVPFQFLLPPDSKERLTIGSALLLGMIILITMIQGFLPEAHPTLPYIVQYYCITMIWIALSMVFSIWVMNIQGRGPSKHKVPGVIRKLFLKTLKSIVCVSEDNYYPLEESETISFRGVEKQLAANETPKSEGDKMERDIDEILRHVNSLLLRSVLTESRAHARTEWYQVALVFDRVMCFLFGLVFIVYSCILLA